jgi:hypothetical protein
MLQEQSPTALSSRDPTVVQPRQVPRASVVPRRFVNGQTVVDVVPVVGCSIGWINAQCLNGIDELKSALDLWPARQAQQDPTTRLDARDARTALAGRRRMQNIDPGQNGPKVAGCPANKCEHATRCEREDSTVMVNHPFSDRTAEPNPVLDPLLEPE